MEKGQLLTAEQLALIQFASHLRYSALPLQLCPSNLSQPRESSNLPIIITIIIQCFKSI